MLVDCGSVLMSLMLMMAGGGRRGGSVALQEDRMAEIPSSSCRVTPPLGAKK